MKAYMIKEPGERKGREGREKKERRPLPHY